MVFVIVMPVSTDRRYVTHRDAAKSSQPFTSSRASRGWDANRTRTVVDEAGFTEWAAGHERQLLRSTYLLCGDLHRAQDLVQEALVKVALRWPRLRDGNPTAYARTIIVRDNISWWRRQREVPSAHSADLEGVSSDPTTAMVVQRSLARLREGAPELLDLIGGTR
jgi:DNA-directed RNA polymerase specialized sigma24 family protein